MSAVDPNLSNIKDQKAFLPQEQLVNILQEKWQLVSAHQNDFNTY